VSQLTQQFRLGGFEFSFTEDASTLSLTKLGELGDDVIARR
jgi:hypothetical protein